MALHTKLLFNCNNTPILKIDKTNILCFQKGMAIDADGCPTAYHPDNTGLDDLKHGGYPGNWWGIATDDQTTGGNPLIQQDHDPAPGYYVSTTSLINEQFGYSDPARYVNARVIPYFVLPKQVAALVGLGDIAWIYNRANGQSCFAIFADIGPDVGEGSMYLASRIGVDDNPRTGGIDIGIYYFVFPGSGLGNGIYLSEAAIIQRGEKAMKGFDKSALLSVL